MRDIEKHRKENLKDKNPDVFIVGQRVWFLKSMRMCRVVEAHDDGTYTVEIMDSGKRLVATSEGLAVT